jgi:hypothetical protein
MSLKNPVTPPGIDPGTVQLVGQSFNHYTTPYGISGKAKLLLESYLQNRYKKVEIINSYLNSNSLKWARIKYGMLHGTILGPILFLVYINGLPKAIGHKAVPIFFTDDISILITSPNNIQLKIILI